MNFCRGIAVRKASNSKRAGQAVTEDLADRIIAEMVERGRTMVDICGDAGMPSRTTVYRWLAERPDFRARVDAAQEAIADHAVNRARTIVDACTPETANADRVKIQHYQWEAARMAPRRYSEKRIAELTGKDGGPVEINNRREVVTIDASRMTPEQRQELRQILLVAKATSVGDDD